MACEVLEIGGTAGEVIPIAGGSKLFLFRHILIFVLCLPLSSCYLQWTSTSVFFLREAVLSQLRPTCLRQRAFTLQVATRSFVISGSAGNLVIVW